MGTHSFFMRAHPYPEEKEREEVCRVHLLLMIAMMKENHNPETLARLVGYSPDELHAQLFAYKDLSEELVRDIILALDLPRDERREICAAYVMRADAVHHQMADQCLQEEWAS